MMIEVFLGIDVRSFPFWVGFPFFSLYCPIYIIGKCGGCGASDCFSYCSIAVKKYHNQENL